MVDALCVSDEIVKFRADQIRAMILEDGFNNAAVVRDIESMRTIRNQCEQLFSEGGHITLGISALIMKARESHVGIAMTAELSARDRAMLEGLEAARCSAYFAVRTARVDTMRRAVWLYAFFLEHVGQRALGLVIL
jgi:hypothetical protein